LHRAQSPPRKYEEYAYVLDLILVENLLPYVDVRELLLLQLAKIDLLS